MSVINNAATAPPVGLECSADGRDLAVVRGPRRFATVTSIRIACAAPCPPGQPPPRPYPVRYAVFCRFSPRAVLDELRRQDVPLKHHPSRLFAEGYFEANCVEGLQTGVGWSLLGQNVLQIELCYTYDDVLFGTPAAPS